MSDAHTEPIKEQVELLENLLAAGHLTVTNVQGVYGHGAEYEMVRERITHFVSDVAKRERPARYAFSPVVSRRDLETNGYLGNFPHLAGSIFGFDGEEREAREQGKLAEAHGDWSRYQSQTDLMMLPAACYPLYPTIAAAGPVSTDGMTVDIGSAWVYRREPSLDPARRQSFRMHEIVRIGSPDDVSAWRLRWSQTGLKLFAELGLTGELINANDPFFGRVGRLKAANQSADELKLELVVPIAGLDPTACASFNYAADHFGEMWGIKLEDGSIAHTACAAFGEDRIVSALFNLHGFSTASWPSSVLAVLDL